MAKNSVVKITKQHNGDYLIEVKGQPPLTFHYGKTSLLVRKSFEDFGIVNKFMNKMSVSAGADGKASPAEKYAQAKAMVEHFESGTDDWNMKGAGRSAGPDMTLLIRALIELHGLADVDAANALLDRTAAKHKVERDVVVTNLWGAKDIVAKVAEYRLAARKFEINSDDYLAEMGEGDDEQD